MINYQKVGITIDPPEGMDLPGIDGIDGIVAEGEEGEADELGQGVGGGLPAASPDGFVAKPTDGGTAIKT